MDTEQLRKLLDLRDQIDQDIRNYINGIDVKERKTQKCRLCGSTDHNARACPNKSPATS